MKQGWTTEKEWGADAAPQELRPPGPTDGHYEWLLPGRGSSVFHPGLRHRADSFHAGFGGGCGVDLLEGRSRIDAHLLVAVG